MSDLQHLPKLSTFLKVLSADLTQHALALQAYPAGAVAEVAPNLEVIVQGVVALEARVEQLEAVAADLGILDDAGADRPEPDCNDRPAIEITAAGYAALGDAPQAGTVVSFARARKAAEQRRLQLAIDRMGNSDPPGSIA